MPAIVVVVMSAEPAVVVSAAAANVVLALVDAVVRTTGVVGADVVGRDEEEGDGGVVGFHFITKNLWSDAVSSLTNSVEVLLLLSFFVEPTEAFVVLMVVGSVAVDVFGVGVSGVLVTVVPGGAVNCCAAVVVFLLAVSVVIPEVEEAATVWLKREVVAVGLYGI